MVLGSDVRTPGAQDIGLRYLYGTQFALPMAVILTCAKRGMNPDQLRRSGVSEFRSAGLLRGHDRGDSQAPI